LKNNLVFSPGSFEQTWEKIETLKQNDVSVKNVLFWYFCNFFQKAMKLPFTTKQNYKYILY